jgi:ankyrin repeat protein
VVATPQGDSQGDDANAPERPICAAHGLRYDSALYTGCVLCRRPAQPATEPSPARSVWTPTTLLMLAASGVLALAVFGDFGAGANETKNAAQDMPPQGPLASVRPHAEAKRERQAGGVVPDPGAPSEAENAERTACARAASGIDQGREDSANAVGTLHRAAAKGDLPKLVQEIDSGARVDEQDGSGRTALAWAIAAVQESSVRALLDARANPNLASHQDVTPLMLAAATGLQELVAPLVQHGARPNAVDAHARTALMLAARNNRADAIAALVQNGAVINVHCERGMTALQHAAEACTCTEAVARLIDLGADVDAIDLRGASALMIAAHEGHSAAARVLLDHGARLDLRDHQGLSVLDYVVMPRDTLPGTLQQGLRAVLQLLVDRKVDPRLGQNPASTQILFRADLDAWAREEGRPPLPAFAALEPTAPQVNAKDDSHGVIQLFRRASDASRSFPAWLYPEVSIRAYAGWVDHVPNIIQQVRLPTLLVRTGQQITLSADAAGNEPWAVDDALLIERLNGSQRVASTFVGRPASITLAGQALDRLGPQAFTYTRGAVDFSGWFGSGSGADRLLVSVVDYGGGASVSDVFLHVAGPHAAGVLKAVAIEATQPK